MAEKIPNRGERQDLRKVKMVPEVIDPKLQEEAAKASMKEGGKYEQIEVLQATIDGDFESSEEEKLQEKFKKSQARMQAVGRVTKKGINMVGWPIRASLALGVESLWSSIKASWIFAREMVVGAVTLNPPSASEMRKKIQEAFRNDKKEK